MRSSITCRRTMGSAREWAWSRTCEQPRVLGSRFCYLHEKVADGTMNVRYPIGGGDRVDVFHPPDDLLEDDD